MSNANGDGRSVGGRQELINAIVDAMPKLKAFGISLAGNLDRAEDLVQQTVLSALTNLHLFEPGTNLEAWLFTILRNRFLSEYRNRKRHGEVEWESNYENDLRWSVGEGQSQAEANAEVARLVLCLLCLPVEQRHALIAIGYVGMSYEEAAVALRTEVGTIKSRVNRARTMLCQIIDDGKISHGDLWSLKNATQAIPVTDPFYPIAAAYEDLYTSFAPETPTDSDEEKAWKALVDSGALDRDDQDLFENSRYEALE